MPCWPVQWLQLLRKLGTERVSLLISTQSPWLESLTCSVNKFCFESEKSVTVTQNSHIGQTSAPIQLKLETERKESSLHITDRQSRVIAHRQHRLNRQWRREREILRVLETDNEEDETFAKVYHDFLYNFCEGEGNSALLSWGRNIFKDRSWADSECLSIIVNKTVLS